MDIRKLVNEFNNNPNTFFTPFNISTADFFCEFA